MKFNWKHEAVLFSIVLPTYNVGRYISRCLESCLTQTYSNFEVIVVDDCGSDDSIEQAAALAKHDRRITIVKNNDNKGTYLARKAGVLHAQGQYILFLDPDDELRSDCLEKLSGIVRNNTADIVFFEIKYMPDLKVYIPGFKIKIKLPKAADNNTDVLYNTFLNNAKFNYGTPGKMYSRTALQNAYRLSTVPENCRLVFSEDVLMLFLVAVCSENSAIINEQLYIYHQNDESITNNLTFEAVQYRLKQIDTVILHLRKQVSGLLNNYTALKVAHALLNRLQVDKLLYMRMIEPKDGGDYFLSMKGVIKLRFKVIDSLRIFLYFVSLKKIRL